MTKDEALKMAIEALEWLSYSERTAKQLEAIDACKEALQSEASEQEPVAYMYADEKTAHVLWKGDKPPAETIALYTHPHQWQGLTDDEIDKIFEDIIAGCYGDDGFYIKFTHAIEQALKEKNT